MQHITLNLNEHTEFQIGFGFILCLVFKTVVVQRQSSTFSLLSVENQKRGPSGCFFVHVKDVKNVSAYQSDKEYICLLGSFL